MMNARILDAEHPGLGQRLTLPAYARALLAKRRHGLAPRRDLLIACDWKLGRPWPWRIVVPVDTTPEQLDFSVAAGLSCLLVGRDQTQMDCVAAAVSAFSPLRVIGVNYEAQTIRVYVAAPITAPAITLAPRRASDPEAQCAA